ncbi:pentatricopeptide repeat-containing protein At1g34160 [Trifolium pratense]|uniref:pentatricopeptide repeat-containing protein At1g34160 n=1 Tax=Trifolium pratense TaxID=57577 RepID=UPI001E698189|nr:pentatricopeptide repeat-containing protein At1g34160 [Trifolium pratense]
MATQFHIDSLLQKCNSLIHMKQLQAHLITTGKFQFHPSRTKLLELFAVSPAGNLSFAGNFFRQIQNPTTNDYNAVLRGLAQSSEPTQSISWYRNMLRCGKKIDALTCSFALKGCARALAFSEATQLHSQVLRYGFDDDVLLVTTLLDVYAKSGYIDDAKKVFDEMQQRDIASWNAMISGLAQGSRPNEAIDLFNKMKEEGWRPNDVTVLGALSACSQLGALKQGEIVHGYIVDEKLENNVIVCNAVIDMYGKCGFVDKAYSVFNSMSCRKSLITWNTMIMAFAMNGDGYKALDLLDRMILDGMCPDAVSYLAALCGCNHAGLVDEGVRLFDLMKVSGVEINVKHYGSVIDLLGRAGRLKEAYDIINSMPMLPDVVLWQTLLGASKTYGNVEMAEVASKKLVEMGSNSCGDFVLLSNVYAAQQRWKDVGRVREAMVNNDVRKVPGFSFTEIDGRIHKFINSDQSHPNSTEIYAKLDEIKFRIKSYGYIAETNLVLHDIGDEDKENVINYHSEKLAVAYGLISTVDGTPILVIKNLRICVDCHTFIKIISNIYNREIIVRDRARFHRFKDGVCSCRDYW